eukprot:3129116-Pyramimonas_sp.AAC.1
MAQGTRALFARMPELVFAMRWKDHYIDPILSFSSPPHIAFLRHGIGCNMTYQSHFRLRGLRTPFGRLGVVQSASCARRGSDQAPLVPLGGPFELFGVIRSICYPVV